MMEVTPTQTPAEVATTTPAAGMASTIGKVRVVLLKWFQEKFRVVQPVWRNY